MHSSRRPAPRPLRRPAASAAAPVAAAPPVTWEQTATAATALVRSAQGGCVHVQALCWPIVPTAWPLLQQALQLVQASRLSSLRDGNGGARSWVGASAPQLSEPFRDTAAEESSVAALLARTPIQLSVGLATFAEAPTAEALATARRQSLIDCLAAYGESLRVPGRSSCRRVLVAGGAETEPDLEAALKRVRLRLDDADALRGLRLQTAQETPAPLPLEAAAVIARAVAEHLGGGESVHAILDVAVAKLARVPPELARGGKPKRR
ncbi:hypothetical protein [Tahibacter caeni]|uniref:hypothetical protein n=1 Tax=Tahibacter caeni TaxID=1453545 RepID=UPI00214781AE|nr:hypothetical protein [Tahibacter caeni]